MLVCRWRPYIDRGFFFWQVWCTVVPTACCRSRVRTQHEDRCCVWVRAVQELPQALATERLPTPWMVFFLCVRYVCVKPRHLGNCRADYSVYAYGQAHAHSVGQARGCSSDAIPPPPPGYPCQSTGLTSPWRTALSCTML